MKQKRNTKQRRLVLEAVTSRCDHPTADEIYTDVHSKDDKISRGTVYRNLNILDESGEILHIKVPSADRYDSRLDRHYHLFCISCGKVSDAPLDYQEEYDAKVAGETGFRVQRHRTVFEGLCTACQAKLEESQKQGN